MNGAIAAIDLGTNSFHLLIVQPQGAGYKFKIMDHVKETVRLGSGSTDMKHIPESAVERAIETLKRFKKLADVCKASVRAIGTSAIREALNQHQFIDQVRFETGIHVEVVSGFEEARLIYLGVLQALPVFNRQALIIDIGGGSTEFLLGLHRTVLYSNSLKIGAIRLTERFFPEGKFKRSAIDQCRNFVSGTLSPVARDLKKLGHEIAIGSSGTALTIAKAACLRRSPANCRQLNGMVLSKAELFDAISDILQARTADKIATIAGVEPGRADIIVSGAIILEQILQRLRLSEFTCTEASLQEGIILDAIEKRRRPLDHHYLSNLRRHTIAGLAESYSSDRRHESHVANLALQLFDQLVALHRLGPGEREILEFAAMLHDIGFFISRSAHHKHSYYLIRNAELLGFTENEKALMANIARYHRKSHPKLKHDGFVDLTPEERTVVTKLSALLRVADGLDRSHTASVSGLACAITPHRVICRLFARQNADLSLEIWGAERKKGLFEETFRREIVFEKAE